MGHIEILNDATYEFDQTFLEVMINGVNIGLNGKGNVPLRKGTHAIRVAGNNHGGPRLQDARLAIRNPQSDEQVAVFCYGSEIERFQAQAVAGWKTIEVSGWQPVEVKSSR